MKTIKSDVLYRIGEIVSSDSPMSDMIEKIPSQVYSPINIVDIVNVDQYIMS